MREIKLQDLKSKTPAELVSFAEENGVENASTMRKQELMFAILKQLAIAETDIIGEGVVEVLSDGFGFLRPGTPIICPVRTTSTCRLRRSGALDFVPATPLKAISAARRKANAISRC
jgi:hypothetical protein